MSNSIDLNIVSWVSSNSSTRPIRTRQPVQITDTYESKQGGAQAGKSLESFDCPNLPIHLRYCFMSKMSLSTITVWSISHRPTLPDYFLPSKFDGLLLIKACLTQRLSHCSPISRHDESPIRSGFVSVYKHKTSDFPEIDGISWKFVDFDGVFDN